MTVEYRVRSTKNEDDGQSTVYHGPEQHMRMLARLMIASNDYYDVVLMRVTTHTVELDPNGGMDNG